MISGGEHWENINIKITFIYWNSLQHVSPLLTIPTKKEGGMCCFCCCFHHGHYRYVSISPATCNENALHFNSQMFFIEKKKKHHTALFMYYGNIWKDLSQHQYNAAGPWRRTETFSITFEHKLMGVFVDSWEFSHKESRVSIVGWPTAYAPVHPIEFWCL